MCGGIEMSTMKINKKSIVTRIVVIAMLMLLALTAVFAQPLMNADTTNEITTKKQLMHKSLAAPSDMKKKIIAADGLGDNNIKDNIEDTNNAGEKKQLMYNSLTATSNIKQEMMTLEELVGEDVEELSEENQEIMNELFDEIGDKEYRLTSQWYKGWLWRLADVTGDGMVDLSDLAQLLAYWEREDCSVDNDWCEFTDIDRNGRVYKYDLLFVLRFYGFGTN